MLSKRVIIDNGRMIYSFYINKKNDNLENLDGFLMI